MCVKKKSGTSNLNCSKKNMKKFFNNEDWNVELGKMPPTMDGIKQDLESMNPEKLKEFKLKTQTNLAKATLQNKNAAIEYGVPVASFLFSVIAIVFSIRLAEPTSYTISGQEINPNPSEGSSNIVCALYITVAIALGIAIWLIGCEFCRLCRKHEVFYYQTILNIIASIEEERERSNHYDVSVHNTETDETKHFDAHLLPKNK